MSKKALFIIPPERFNEDELFHPKEELENNGIEVTIASTKIGQIKGDYEGKVDAEVIFRDASVTNYDIIAVIGGSGTNDYLCENQELQDYLKKAYDEKVLLTGICAGAIAVAKTGLLSGREATCYPIDMQINELQANNVKYVNQHVVAHEDIITGDGPEGAREFGENLVAALR